jgi:predicted transcriptional regulator
MTKTKVTVAIGGLDEYVKRSTERARKIDRGEAIKPEINITFADPADLLAVLAAERRRLLHTLRKQKVTISVSGLAEILGRDRKAVARDVELLESHGLLRTRRETNPGHGVNTLVEPLAKKYHLTATF